MKVVIAFSKIRYGFFDRVISWWTGSVYTHVEMIMPCGNWLGVRQGNPWMKRKPLRRIAAIEHDCFNDRQWDTVEFDVNEEQVRDIWDFFKKTQGARYDWIGVIFSHVFNIRIKSENKWYCSEWVAHALEKAGVLDWRKVPIFQMSSISPARLHKICLGEQNDRD